MQNIEAFELRKSFHNEIRSRQHQAIFKKYRCQALSEDQTSRRSIDQVLEMLNNIEYKCKNINSIFDNMQKIQTLLQNSRQIRYNPTIENGFLRILAFVKSYVTIVQSHVRIDIEENEEHPLGELQGHPFTQLLQKTNYFLIDFMSYQTIYSQQVLTLVANICNYPQFSKVYFNIFLSQDLPPHLKLKFSEQFVRILGENPQMFLQNCCQFVQILYYCVQKSPKLHQLDSIPCIKEMLSTLNKLVSILTYNTQLPILKLKEIQMYIMSILAELCLGCQTNCWNVVNMGYLMGIVENHVKEVSFIIGEQGTRLKQKGMKQNDEMLLQHLVCGFRVLANLTFYDQICEEINTYRPQIIIMIIKIMSKLGTQNYGKNQIPQVFLHGSFPSLCNRIFKTLGNLVCKESICQIFQQILSGGAPGKWVEVVEDVYNSHFKNTEARVHVLLIYVNVLSNITKSMQISMDCTFQHYDYRPETDEDDDEDEVGQNKNRKKQLFFILEHVDLITETLKLSNNHKNIIVCLLSTLRRLVQMHPELKHSVALSSPDVTSRINNLFEQEMFKSRKGVDAYDENVKYLAQTLMEAIFIDQ